jgi:hypothetical protein
MAEQGTENQEINPEVKRLLDEFDKQIPVDDREELYPAIMTSERIIGALIYAVMRGELTSEIVQLARTLPPAYYHETLGDGWGDVSTFVHCNLTFPMDERTKGYVQHMLSSEIEGILWSAAHPGESRLIDLDEEI